ncbi:MAG: MFS transporter [Janthinobacterium lividum]
MNLSASRKNFIIVSLGLSQLVGWGTAYYAFGVLLRPMQIELQLSKNIMVGAYSLALLISGAMSIVIGRIIDRFGGRLVMSAGSVLASLMLVLTAFVHNATGLYLVWAGMGLAMSAILYQPAFAVLMQVFGDGYRRAITLLTLIGGFSSTLAWPLTQAVLSSLGWRQCWLLLAAANLLLCLPVHAMLPKRSSAARMPAAPLAQEHGGGNAETDAVPPAPAPPQKHSPLASVVRDPVFQLITVALTLNSLVSSAILLHLLTFLQSRGISAHQAALIGALLGPMQVLGRILEILFGKDATSRQIGTLAMWVAPLALAMLVFPATWLVVYGAFAAVYGLGNGVMTLVRGTLPAELYGQASYGVVSGAMSMPVMFASAAGPFAASLLYTAAGGYEGVIPALGAISVVAVCLFMTGVARSESRTGMVSH